MADDWVTTTFAQLIEQGTLEIGDGYRAKNDELGGNGPVFLRAGHVRDTHIDFAGVDRFRRELLPRLTGKMAQAGDAVVTTKGNSTGRASFVTEEMPEFVYSPHLSYWRSKDSSVLAAGFLRYWSRSPEFMRQLAGMKASTDMAPYLSLIDQRRLRISLPPAGDQHAIAHILGSLDEKIELNRRMSETLDEMARAIFKSWFVDFEPVRAKATGEPTGLGDDLSAHFPSGLEPSDLGEIPEGWTTGSILAIADLISGGTPKTSVDAYWGGDIPWASAKDVSQCSGLFLGGTERRITEAGLNGSSTKMIPANATVVVARGATTGRVALFAHEMAMNQTCYALTSTTDTPFALSCLFRHWVPALVGSAHGSVFDTITTRTVQNTSVVLPSVSALRAFETLAAPMLSRVRAATLESGSLAALRDTLLPKLVSGELRVPDAEKFVESLT